jgi:hypothetical protein
MVNPNPCYEEPVQVNVGAMSETPTPVPAVIRVDATDGEVTLRDATNGIWLAACQAGVALGGGRYETFDEATRPETGVDGLVVRRPGRGDRPELRWHFQRRPKDQAVALWLEIHNATGDSLVVERLDVLVAPGGFLAGASESQRFSRPLATPWLAAIEGAGNHSLWIGFASAGVQAGEIEIDAHSPRLVARTHPAGVQLPPGGTLASELLLLIVDQPVIEARRLFEAEMALEARATAIRP